MPDWFGDGVERPFRESVSFTNFTLSLIEESILSYFTVKNVQKLVI